jgi:hypothetical protein
MSLPQQTAPFVTRTKAAVVRPTGVEPITFGKGMGYFGVF